MATNILGQNTPAIAATEAQYGEMWAQDAAAMYGYALASAAATKLIPFTPPPPTTNQAGTAGQAAAVSNAVAARPSVQSGLTQAMNLVPGALQSLGSGGSFDPLGFFEAVLGTTTGQALNTYTMDVGNWALVISGPLFTASGITPLLGGLYGLAVPQAAAVASDVAPDAGLGALAGSSTSAASASVGEAATVGKLSVPQSWTSPSIRLAASGSPLASASLDGLPEAGAAEPGNFFGGIPPVGSLVNAPRGEQTRVRSGAGQKVIPTMPGEPGPDAPNPVAPGQAQPSRRHVASALSDREREELARLRKDIADAAMERDAAARLIKEAML